MNRAISTLIFLLSFFVVSYVHAESGETRGITSYGEHCDLCGDYGYCTRMPTHRDAVNALRSFYEKKGLRVMVLKQKGRFLEAEVYRNNDMVDRILLDLMTGRIRSIY